MRILQISSAIALAIIVVGPVSRSIGGAQVTKQGAKYLFRQKYTKGAVYQYLITSSTTMAGAAKPMSFEMPATIKVMDVDAKGTATLNVTLDMSKLQPGSKPKAQTMKMDNRGNLVSGGQGGLMGTNLPEKPVAVGESWKAKASAMGGAGDAVYKFEGLKTVSGKQVAVLSVKLNSVAAANGQQIKAAGNGTTYIGVADGQLVSMSMAMTMNNPGAGGKPMNSTMTMRRTN